jgi:two-component system chemotaxis sensor kinase CheA
MIDDAELRTLFQAESEEHLQSLETGLLRLEAEPLDAACLETVFRAAHSLKGSARMLGVEGLESLAHHFEDVLGAARHGRRVLSEAVVERLYRGLDAMRRLAGEAVTGEPSRIELAQVLAQLRGETPPTAEPPSAVPGTLNEEPLAGRTGLEHAPVVRDAASEGGAKADRELAAALPPEGAAAAPLVLEVLPTLPGEGLPAPPEAPSTVASTFKIETIRVEPQRLDALMTRVGELAVTTTRVRRGLGAVDDLAALWEEWSREAALSRRLPGSRAGDAPSLARVNEREQERLARFGRLLERLQRTASEDVTRLDLVADELEEAIRGMRLLPLSTIFQLFPRLVRDLAHAQGKEVQLVIEGGETTADKRLLEELKDPLMHMIRNAIDHGIELPEVRERQGKPRLATLTLRAYQTARHVVLEIGDDGRGLDAEAIRRTALQRRLARADELAALPVEQLHALIFAPGFSTNPLITDVSGRGVGLDVVRANVERLKGSLQVESQPGAGTTFRIRTRITVATTHVLLVRAGDWAYALPVEFVQEAFLVAPEEVFALEGRPAIRLGGQPVSVARLADLLELRAPAAPRERTSGERLPCILLAVGAERFGIFVEALVDEQEVMFKPLGGLLKRVRNVSGATLLGTGEICMILNPVDLLKTLRTTPAVVEPTGPAAGEVRRKLILLAEDSLTTRTQEKRILESAGYEVVTAVDGADAFAKLGTRPFDAVISDVEMPNMDGLTLAARIREDPQYLELPILLVTSLASEEDRRRGSEVGANAYLTKGTFDQKALLDTLRRLV